LAWVLLNKPREQGVAVRIKPLLFALPVVALLALWAALPGCVIGTWPTPELTSGEASRGGRQYIGQEACDGLDNDGDGSVDEGCPCGAVGDARGCYGSTTTHCGPGVQWCADRYWGKCVDIGPPMVPKREPSITFSAVDPSALKRGAAGTLTAQVAVTPACPGVRAPNVRLELSSKTPFVMRVRTTANDDGTGSDTAVSDGTFTGVLNNAFGPGVPAQTLSLTATATLEEKDRVAETTVELTD
jgi:hypothetical protein